MSDTVTTQYPNAEALILKAETLLDLTKVIFGSHEIQQQRDRIEKLNKKLRCKIALNRSKILDRLTIELQEAIYRLSQELTHSYLGIVEVFEKLSRIDGNWRDSDGDDNIPPSVIPRKPGLRPGNLGAELLSRST